MRRNMTLMYLARELESCNEQRLVCEQIFVHCCRCVNELADNSIRMVQQQLDKPEIKSCRIPLEIDYKNMTNLDYWLKSELFSTPFKDRSEPLRQKIVQLVNMLRALQLKIQEVDTDYAEKVFKRMAARLKKSTYIFDYEIWRKRYPNPTMKQLEEQQVQLTAKMLIAGIMEYDEDAKDYEVAQVQLELVKRDLIYGQKLPDNFKEECAKLRRYSYWKGEHLFMINYKEIYTYLFSHCFDKFTEEQHIALYEYDVQLKMIHEDMVRLMPELKDREEHALHTVSPNEKLCKFIHPTIDDEEGVLIHEEVKRLVKRNGVQMICEYLQKMARDEKILLPPNPSIAYAELVRIGMPTGEGYSEKYFRNHYLRK